MSRTELILEFEKLTDRLLSLDFSGKDQSMLEKIIELLDARAKIIEAYQEDAGDVEKDLLYRVLQKDNELETRMQEMKLGIEDKLSTVLKEKSQSAQKRKAVRGYMKKGHQNDGYFIDKKK